MKVILKKGATVTVSKPKTSTVVKDEYSLPTEATTPSENLSEYVQLVYGEKKIGKTSMWSHTPGTFFMMCESGDKALSLFRRPVLKWEDFKAYVYLLERDRKFTTVIVDPVDNAHVYCTRYVCKKMGIDHPSDENWGKGWSAVREEFTDQINRLTNSGKGVVFLSHATEREIKTRTGVKYDKIVPTMSGSAREVLEGIVDIWAYYTYEDGKRVLVIQGDDHIGAGHRLSERHFRYPSGKRISTIPMGGSSKEAYQNFVAAFNNQLKEK